MALAAIVSSLDAIPEAHRALYVADGDKFKLDVEGGEDTAAMRIELATVKREAAERRKAAKEIEEKYAGIDPEKVRTMMSKLDQDGEQALIAAGKIEEVIAKRSEKLRADLQRQLDEAQGKANAAEARTKKYSQRVLDDQVRAAAADAGLTKYGTEDALTRIRANGEFVLGDDGIAVQLDADGHVVLGKDGKTPFSLAEWMPERALDRPNWFPLGASGGGASGSGNSAGGKTMTRAALEALPPRDRAAAVKAYTIRD